MLHCHIIKQPPQSVSANFRSLEEWKISSQAALDTATRMVMDIAECHGGLSAEFVNSTPPSHIYIVRASLRHMYNRAGSGDIPWSPDSEEQLHFYFNQFNRRWGVVYN